MDQKIWGIAPLEDVDVSYVRVDGKAWSSYVDDLKSYLNKRLSYMSGFYGQDSWKYCKWYGSSIDTWVPYLEGKAITDGWVMDGLNWYFMQSGKLATGWLYYGGNWHWFNLTDGAMKKSWLRDGINWSYANFNEKMQTGWRSVKSTWYFFDNSCAMATG